MISSRTPLARSNRMTWDWVPAPTAASADEAGEAPCRTSPSAGMGIGAMLDYAGVLSVWSKGNAEDLRTREEQRAMGPTTL